MMFTGLRARVTLLVAAVVVVSVGIGFAAIYRGTSRQLERRSEVDLRADMANLQAAVIRDPQDPAAVAGRARAFLTRQPFRPTEHVTFVKVPGRPAVSNQAELLGLAARESDETADRVRAEAHAAIAFLGAGPGVSTRSLPDAGAVRLLVRDVRRDGRPIARLGVGEPTAAVNRFRDVALDVFLLAGGLAIALALAGGFVVASRVAAPLRRMARVATDVDAGDMGPRMAVAAGQADEVKVLGDAFDHMLDRLQGAFDRQAGFVADASHELRTPLTVIRGQVELLSLQPPSDAAEVERVAGMVRNEVQRMARLVDDMLLLAQAGERSFLRPSTVDVAAVLGEVAAGLAPGGGRSIEIGARPAVTIRADPDRLIQALRNLLRNALAHADAKVTIGAEVSATTVRFAVDDDGAGIPEDQRERVFDRFHRVDPGHARAEGGAGLGLAIVRAIAEAHGGRAWAGASALGGARVVVELPLGR